MHFGHCEEFTLFKVDPDTKQIISAAAATPPPHEPGVLPKWLHEIGATHIIAGGMGTRAQQLFSENEIAVIVGAPAAAPEQIAKAYLDGTLEIGGNACDH